MKNLIIVESPTKAKTIEKFLGKGFVVKSSFGHVRDLPKSKLGVDVEHDFAPTYSIPRTSQKVVTELKKAAAGADKVYFASDEDREGEAISWHLSQILKVPAEKSKRIAFHEITKDAINAALAHPRDIDQHLVDAQQARRILDRLVGYKLSPFLWRKIARGLSAGRVQSVAVRLIVEREREIQAFQKEEFWTIEVALKTDKGEEFITRLYATEGKTLEKFSLKTDADADAIATELKKAAYAVKELVKRAVRRSAPPPFITSTLQQDANRKLGFSAKQTMMIAQQLYEQGFITYMRTDSLNLAEKFIGEAATYIKERFGEKFSTPHKYTTKDKAAQEAHEAVRPTDAARATESVASELNPQQTKLYDLIWRRALASQMPDAELEATTADIEGRAGKNYTLRATGSIVKFAGFLKLMPEGQKDILLPELARDQKLGLVTVDPIQHFTEPPPRYSDASLVKILEEYGIGRPSTYAPTIGTIIDRGYVERIEGRRLKPTDIAFQVIDLLVEHFSQVVDYQFTARIEEDLDAIADGKKPWVPVIRAFWDPFSALLAEKESEIKKEKVPDEPTDEVCDKCGKPMVIKAGRFGKFIACSGFPECRNTKKIESPAAGTGVACPKCGEGEITEKRTRRGKVFFSCNRYPKCDFALWSKPTGEKCPACGSLMVLGPRDTTRCSNKECPQSKIKKEE